MCLSKVNPCVLISKNIVFLVYVEILILFMHKGKDSEINNLIKILEAKFELTDKGLLKDYLGIDFTQYLDGTLKMMQTHLINQIIDTLELPNTIRDAKNNPVTQPILHKDEEGSVR